MPEVHTLQRLGERSGYLKPDKTVDEKYVDIYVKINPTVPGKTPKDGNTSGMLLVKDDGILDEYMNENGTPLSYNQIKRLKPPLDKIKVIRK